MAVAAAAAAVAGGLVGAATAHAQLTVDLRAVAVNGQPLGGGDTPKQVTVNTGDVLTFHLFGRITGTNGVNDEGLTSAHGSVMSGNGGLLGNLSGGPVAPFNDSGSQAGSVQDIDHDGDLDVGVTPNGGTPTTGYFIARAAALQPNGVILDANSEEFHIGQFTLSVTGNAGDTSVNFFRRANASGGEDVTAAVWSQDGTAKNGLGDGYGAGTPVHVVLVPEPAGAAAASAAAAIASLGLLRRRPAR
jgi:hypothetical protein